MTRLQSNRYEQLKKIHEEIIFHPKDLKTTYNLLLYGPELFYAYELLPSIKDTIAHYLQHTCQCKEEAKKMGLEGPIAPLCPCDLLKDFLVNGNTLIPLFKLNYDEYKRFLKLHESTFDYLYDSLRSIFPKGTGTFLIEQYYAVFALFLRKDFNFELLRTITAEDIEAIRDTLPKVQSGLYVILNDAERDYREDFQSYPFGSWDEKIAFHALYTIYADGEPYAPIHYLSPKGLELLLSIEEMLRNCFVVFYDEFLELNKTLDVIKERLIRTFFTGTPRYPQEYSDLSPRDRRFVHYLYPKLENTVKHIIRSTVNNKCKKAKINGRDRKALRKILYKRWHLPTPDAPRKKSLSKNARILLKKLRKNDSLKKILNDAFYPYDNKPNPISAKIYIAIEELVDSYKDKYDFFTRLNDVN